MECDLDEVFCLYYVYEYEDGHEDTKLLGVFSTEANANRALSQILQTPQFQKMSSFFEIANSKINRIGWAEGFFTSE